MSFVELLLVAVGLSMDAFAVSVCKGLSVKKLGVKHALIAGAYFGGFQFLMPVIGWFLGSRFEHIITSFDHWIAFGLLAIIGVNMIQESYSKAEDLNDDFGVKTMLMMAVATALKLASCPRPPSSASRPSACPPSAFISAISSVCASRRGRSARAVLS